MVKCSYIQLPKLLHGCGLTNIKNNDNFCFIWSYIRWLNPIEKNPSRITIKDKKIFNDIYHKLKNFNFPLNFNKDNIKDIEDILQINIFIFGLDLNYNTIHIFNSNNIYDKNLHLLYYNNHICLIRDLYKYVYNKNKIKNKKFKKHICKRKKYNNLNIDKIIEKLNNLTISD